ncbi:MAG TPA: hemolysin family protein [Natronosporangium sp.]|nr:hemolysin family protein [Natronosporangium sp.]
MDGIGSLPTFALLIWAGALILLGGLAATVDAALGVISLARATALARGRVNGEVGGRRAEQPVPWGAAALEKVAADRARYRSLLVMLRVACEVTATVLVALVAVTALGMGAAAVLVAVAVMTTVGFVVVGAVPRLLGPRHAYLVGRLAAPALRWLGRLLRPLTWLLGLVGRALTAGRVQRDAPFATPDNGEPDLTVELRELVDLAEERGGVERGEREMIDSVFRLGDTVAREVMVPRTEMVWIEAHKSLRQGLALALRSGFSRIPVIGASVDDVLGVVYLKDLARRTVGGDPTLADSVRVDQVMRKALFVPVSKPVDDLLSEMRAARVHMAIVVDEYGGTAGLVTIEDILEEIVGEITDEYDVELPPVQRLPDGSVRVSARLPIEDLGELFGVELPADDVETVAGLMAQVLGRVPIPGATATVNGLRLVAEGTAGRRNRIQTVLVRRVEQPAHAGDATTEGR